MKKMKLNTTDLINPFSSLEKNDDSYEIIYADSRDEEIRLQLLKKAQINTHMARWYYDIDYNQLLWSDGVYGILEIDSTKSGANYETFLNVIHPDDRFIKEETQKSLSIAKHPIEITYRLKMKDGRIKWINEICSADFDQNENPIRFYGIINDITKFKQSESIYLQKEANYKTQIDSFPIAIATYQQGKIIHVNPSGIHIMGAKEENELRGQGLEKFVHNSSLIHFQEKINEVTFRNSSATFEEKLIRFDGSLMNAEITLVHTIEDDNQTIQIIFRDISEQKKTEEALKLSEEKYRLFAILSADVIWTINLEGKVSYVSPFIENCVGYEAKIVIKNIVSKFLSPSSVMSCLIELEEMKSIVLSNMKIEQRKLLLETLGLENNVRWIEVTISSLYDSAYNLIGFSGICRAVTK